MRSLSSAAGPVFPGRRGGRQLAVRWTTLPGAHALAAAVLLWTSLSTPTPASPSVMVGCRAVADLRSTGISFYDSLGGELMTLVYHRPSVGAAVFVEVWPWEFAGLRFDIAQTRFFFEGGSSFEVMPALGAEVHLSPLVRWKVRPLLWCGLQTRSHRMGPDGSYDYPLGPDFHFRFGIGARARVMKAVDVLGEVHLGSSERYTLLLPGIETSQDVFSTIAVEQLRLGMVVSLAPRPLAR